MGSEKTRLCKTVSPNEMNRHIRTCIVAPMTTKGKEYPTRVFCKLKGKTGQIVLDQIRTVDKNRLVKKLGEIQKETQNNLIDILQEIFCILKLHTLSSVKN